MYRQEIADAVQLGGVVAQRCRTHEPLGAYATAERLHYLFFDRNGVLDVTARRLSADPCVPALSGEYPLFDWHEREMRDTHHVALAGLPMARPLGIDDGVPPAALVAEGKGVSVVVVGPVHAGIIEPGRFTFSTGGETVIHLDAQLGYSSRGVERFLEGQPALDAASRVSRICGACSAARSWAYARALELLAGMTCDERSEWARVAIAELERIYNHIFDLASSAAGAGYGYGQTRGLALKERVHAICAAASGHRMLFDAIVPGGVRDGVLPDPRDVQEQVRRLRHDVENYIQALFGNASLMRRFAGAGYVSAQTARAFGAVGPARRASGGDLDVRSCLPYGAYQNVAPVLHTETAGDVAARCRIKGLELTESFALVDRALTEMRVYAPPAPSACAVSAGVLTALTEGPRGCESISVECDSRGLLTRIHVISASYRNWPVVLRAMEDNIIPDFPLVNKSFNLCYACADR